MDESNQSKDRRRFHRILFDAPVSLIFDNNSFTTRLIDISLKGALVKTNTDWQVTIGTRASLTVSLGDDKTEIQMQARAAHTEPDRVGFICDEIDMDSITHLRRLVELNVGDSSLLERELQALG